MKERAKITNIGGVPHKKCAGSYGCGEIKPLESFPVSRIGFYCSYCRDCKNQYMVQRRAGVRRVETGRFENMEESYKNCRPYPAPPSPYKPILSGMFGGTPSLTA